MANEYLNMLREQNWLAQLERKFRTAVNVEHRDVINFARRLMALYPGPYNVLQVCSIYEYLYSQWKYVSDPRGLEYIAPASDSIMIMAGDCDDFAALMATLIEAAGGRSRILIARGPTDCHAYTEVYVNTREIALPILNTIFLRYKDWYISQNIENSERINFHYIESDDSVWLNLDWTAVHPGGPFFEGVLKRIIYPR